MTMFTTLLFLLLAVTVALWILRNRVALWPPLLYLPPVLAALLLILRPGADRDGRPERQEIEILAKAVGYEIGRAVDELVTGVQSVLVIHPDPATPSYTSANIAHQLDGLARERAQTGVTWTTVALHPDMARDDPYADGFYIGPITLDRILQQHPGIQAIVFLGLTPVRDSGSPRARPPLFLANSGDPATSLLWLQSGHAYAVVLERDTLGKKPEGKEQQDLSAWFNYRYELRRNESP